MSHLSWRLRSRPRKQALCAGKARYDLGWVLGRVLVIDDEPAVGRTIRRLLGDAYDVTLLSSGRAAVGLLAGVVEFDVIICDLLMPEVSGIEVYRAVVAARPDLAHRFVFMSGDNCSSRASEFLDSVPNVRLGKPFDLETVRALVRTRVAERSEVATVG
jgi:two-component system, cell cycle sensor histidine kinase and response regulator CckA